MPRAAKVFVRYVDAVNRVIGRAAMYLIFVMMAVLLYGGFSSTTYALQHGEKSFSSWAPRMAPIKIIMTFGLVMMLLQAIATLLRDVARARGLSLTDESPA